PSLSQTSSQTELENWITALHSACAAAFARQHHRDDTVRLLRSEIKKLEQKMDMDEKMKKMGEMQLSSVTDAKKRKTILEQIFLWEQNLEQFHMDWFRFRCYLASLQGGELPNPKRLLAFASRPTKLAMGRLGIFSVSSFHALVAARTESGVFADGEEPLRKNLEDMFEESSRSSVKEKEGSEKTISHHNADSDIWVPEYLTPSWVCLPNDQPVLAIIQPGETTLDALEIICKLYKEIEICSKTKKLIQFDRDESCTIGYGFSITVIEEEGIQQLHISDAGDEIVQLNGKDAGTLNVSDMRAAFSQPSLCLTISAVPVVEPLCPLPPRRSDGEEDLCTDIFSQSQEEILDEVPALRLQSPGDSVDGETDICGETEDGGKVRLQT
ncbi:hypothetical protein JZ751_023013, partial [Albula glossodonta]